jgi:hypothetical protein
MDGGGNRDRGGEVEMEMTEAVETSVNVAKKWNKW